MAAVLSVAPVKEIRGVLRDLVEFRERAYAFLTVRTSRAGRRRLPAPPAPQRGDSGTHPAPGHVHPVPGDTLVMTWPTARRITGYCTYRTKCALRIETTHTY